MNINDLRLFSKPLKFKEVSLNEIREYLSNPNYFDESFDIETITEGIIKNTDKFKVFVSKGSNLKAKDSCVLNDIIIVLLDENDEIIDYSILSSGVNNETKVLLAQLNNATTIERSYNDFSWLKGKNIISASRYFKNHYHAKNISFNEIKNFLTNPNCFSHRFNLYTLTDGKICEDDKMEIIKISYKNISDNFAQKNGNCFTALILIISYDKKNRINEIVECNSVVFKDNSILEMKEKFDSFAKKAGKNNEKI